MLLKSLNNFYIFSTGRAWLYHSLNEGSLEGYLRTFAREGNLLGKHYFKYSLMRDELRMDLLLGLLASIQDISFDLALVRFSLDQR
jgi:pleckstrin homology domain-containing family M member 2